jgi:hypothetical protein
MQSVDEQCFSEVINTLLNGVECADSKRSKMILTIEIYRIINKNLEMLLYDNPKFWTNFAACVYNKTTEFEKDRNAKHYNDINSDLVASFANEYMKARKFLASFLRNVEDPIMLTKPHVVKALANINEKHEKKVSIMKLRGREIVRLV